jgi:spore coat polysaccharide biosynthesis protein SpsF (cytidylyltransferase family)
MNRCVALIQARMSSNRYPGKVLEPLCDIPMISFMVNRVRRSRLLDEVVVVTSTDATDDLLAAHLERERIAFFRGDLHDVLHRYFAAAQAHAAQEYVRLTGDCPLIDPEVLDSVISLRRSAGADYASNIDPPTYPDGLDCECFTRETLQRAHSAARSGPEREHVTLWMRSPDAALVRLNRPAPCDASMLRLTVDYPDDLVAVRRIVELLAPNRHFDFFDILRVVDQHSEITSLNPHVRNEWQSRHRAGCTSALEQES